MRKLTFIALSGIICIVSCKPKQDSLTQNQIQARVDSMVGIKMEEINRQAMEDLDHRMSIEVKAKADSIVDAVMKNAAPPDNTAPTSSNQP